MECERIVGWFRWMIVLARSPQQATPRTIRVTAVSEAWLKELLRDSSRPTDR
jgi:hypothetical protein